jgi:hypothetical protein
MTPEEKAKISRENGAKSRGPKTEQGKARSSRNALKTGEYSEKFKHFIPPHEACIANEERQGYETLVEQLIAIYKPVNQLALDAVIDIAVSRWQIRRFQACITMTWNLSLAAATRRPNTFAPELAEIKVMVDATAELLSGNSVLVKLNREIARLQQVIARAERRIKFVHANFPDSPEQTCHQPDPPIENKPLTREEPSILRDGPTPVYTTECTQIVIDGYRRMFPGRPIVILPSETSDDHDETLPDHTPVPRIAV